MDSQGLVLPTVRCNSPPELLEQINELKSRVSELENKLHECEKNLHDSEEAARELMSENLGLEVETKNTERKIERKIDDLMKILLGEEVSIKRLRLLFSTQSCFLVRKEFSQLCRMLENLDYDEIQSLQEKITNEPINYHETEQLMSNIEVFDQIENTNNLNNLDAH